MTYKEISDMIAAAQLPYAYDHFTDTGQKPPYICFLYPEGDDVIADNKNFVTIKRLQIELYTDNKDFALEHRLEGILRSYELPYADNEGYLSDEQMYMHTYTTEVLINGE